MSKRVRSGHGFSLVELTIVIVVIGILAAVAMQSMTALVEDTRRTKTEREMEMLAKSIVGNPALVSEGGRSDFGYVGDIGAFPPNLDALLNNPGGYATWDGPYIPAGFTQDVSGFKTDEWGQPYNYSGGITITSTGSGSTITKKIADASSDYLLNTVNGTIKDVNDSVPGLVCRDSVDVKITIPDGAGGTVTKTYQPDSAGAFTLDSLPVGRHELRIIYIPEVDTLFRYLTVLPRHKSNAEYRFASAYFSTGGPSGMLELVSGTESIYGGQCDKIKFDIVNNTGADINVSSIKLTWSSPVSYYEKVKFDNTTVFDENNPRSGSGDVSVFTSTQTVTDGSTVTVKIEKFNNNPTGGGGKTNMSSTTFTVLFSDSSTFSVTVGTCP
ncbi:MAG: type II secretion system protein [Candidatus Zixiibacteriota bacterium]